MAAAPVDAPALPDAVVPEVGALLPVALPAAWVAAWAAGGVAGCVDAEGWSSPGAAQSDAQDVPPTNTAAAKNECRIFMTADLLNRSK